MKTKICSMTTKVIGIFLVTIALSGCYSFSSMTKKPDFSDKLAVASGDIKSDKIGYVSSVNAKMNGSVSNTNDGFVKRVIEKLRQSNYFQDVTYGF